MTKEEAKEILISTLRDINSNDNSFEYTTEQFTEAMLIAIESLSNPPLPSNLDEEANCYKNTVTPEEDVYSYETYTEYQITDAFKAGAEWMAGQGVTKEGVARPDDDEIWVNLKNTDIKDGDKIVVQIRKK